MTYVGIHNPGKYIYNQKATELVKSTLDNTQDLTSYCLRMIDLKLSQFINH
jgi:hypothetical protein